MHFSDSRVAEVNAFINAGGIPRLAGEYSSFMMILFLIISIPPAIGCILTVIPTWRYALDDKEHARILAVLIERRGELVPIEEPAEEADPFVEVEAQETAPTEEQVEEVEESPDETAEESDEQEQE